MTAKSILVVAGVFAALGQDPYLPARLEAGAPPPPRVHVITWGHEYLRLSVDAGGRVQRVVSLTPPAGVGARLRDAVRAWSFSPAREAGAPVPAGVLVAGVFRPATLYDPSGSPVFARRRACGVSRRLIPERARQYDRPLPMSLSPGTSLGPYTILAELGHGGMGVVYTAHDPRLKRQGAIKVLPLDHFCT